MQIDMLLMFTIEDWTGEGTFNDALAVRALGN